MAIAHIPMDDSVLAASSIATGAIAFVVLLKGAEIQPIPAAAISATIGIGLYWIGIVPIGFLVILGLAIAGALVKAMLRSRGPR